MNPSGNRQLENTDNFAHTAHCLYLKNDKFDNFLPQKTKPPESGGLKSYL
jgi:hypothetical protein